MRRRAEVKNMWKTEKKAGTRSERKGGSEKEREENGGTLECTVKTVLHSAEAEKD